MKRLFLYSQAQKKSFLVAKYQPYFFVPAYLDLITRSGIYDAASIENQRKSQLGRKSRLCAARPSY
jgi:hypothetical protein